MKNLLKKTNSIVKVVNNLPIKEHYFYCRRHIMSRDYIDAMSIMVPIYEELDSEYAAIDMVDLIFYERWLNERY